MKIAIIVRSETLDRCTAKGCMSAFFERRDSFARCDEKARLVAFTHDGGDLDHKIENLRKHGVDTVHISTCIRARRENYEELAQRLARHFDVVGYTHGSCEGRTRRAICLRKGENLPGDSD